MRRKIVVDASKPTDRCSRTRGRNFSAMRRLALSARLADSELLCADENRAAPNKPGAALALQAPRISTNGHRVYMETLGGAGNLDVTGFS